MITIIFDWGGVLTEGRFTQLLITSVPDGEDLQARYDEFDRILVKDRLTSKRSFEDFVQNINETFDRNFSVEEMRAIFKKAIRPREDVIDFVETLHGKYRLVMLSDNDNETVRNLQTEHKDMLALFEKTYFSNELHMRKPDQKFYEHVIKDLGVTPEECVFIDDKKKNVDGAIASGIHGILFTSIEQLKADLGKLL